MSLWFIRPCTELAVVADGLDGAFLEGSHAGGLLFGVGGLGLDVASAFVVVAAEVARGGLAAEVAIDAGVVDVKPTRRVAVDFVRSFRHVFPES